MIDLELEQIDENLYDEFVVRDKSKNTDHFRHQQNNKQKQKAQDLPSI